MKIRRKVTCVYGNYKDENSDFVLEPVCGIEECDVCKDSFWIEIEVEEKKI